MRFRSRYLAVTAWMASAACSSSSNSTSGDAGATDGGSMMGDAGASTASDTGAATPSESGTVNDTGVSTAGDAGTGDAPSDAGVADAAGDASADADANTGLAPDAGPSDGATAAADATTLAQACSVYAIPPVDAGPLPITLSDAGTATVVSGVTQAAFDTYSFIAPKADPVSLRVAYSVGAGNDSNLGLEAWDITSSTRVTSDLSTRTTSTQILQGTFESAAGGHYSVNVESDGDMCTPFELDISTGVCTDSYEDNDVFAQAPTITLDGTGKATLSASIDGLDDDWYKFAVPKHDPVQVTATYTRPEQDVVQLTLESWDATDATRSAVDSTSRTANTQTLQNIWEPDAAGELYRVHLASSEPGICANYQVAFNGYWCTDTLEDNDSFDRATALPAGASNVTISSLDEDWYAINVGAATGTCTVTYTVEASSVQQLSLELWDQTHATRVDNDGTTRTGLSQTLTTHFGTSGTPPTYVHVVADDQECTPYVVQCQTQ